MAEMDKLEITDVECKEAKEKELGSPGIWTRDLAHPKRESYP